MRRSALLIVLLASLLPSCTTTGPRQATIRIATDATFPPFHYINDGMIEGYDIAVAVGALDRAGYQSTVTQVSDYDELFAGLREGRVDMIAATTGITPERQETYIFSTPHYITCQAALVRTGDGEPRTIGDLAGRRVGAGGSGTSFRAMSSLPAEHVHIQPGADGVAMLRAGDIDALIIDEYEVVALARDNDDLTCLPEPVALERYALVMAPRSTHLKKQLDNALADMARDGTLDELRERFGLNRPDDWPIDIR